MNEFTHPHPGLTDEELEAMIELIELMKNKSDIHGFSPVTIEAQQFVILITAYRQLGQILSQKNVAAQPTANPAVPVSPPTSGEDAAVIRADRTMVYGPASHNFRGIGRVWQGILEGHWQRELPSIPPHVVALMHCGIKLQRAALPFRFVPDNYPDGHNYLDLAREEDPRVKGDQHGQDGTNPPNENHTSELHTTPSRDGIWGVGSVPNDGSGSDGL